MRILAVGGGSGGHVTPVVAVLREIRHKYPDAKIRFWCDRKFAPHARSIMGNFDKSVKVQTISAGKLRRYHHVSALRHLLWPSLILRNIRDIFLVLVGLIQSLIGMVKWRPDVVFTKGGYVCLPVGLAAKILRIPLVIHDSDAHPGLTNRILSKWATAIATGAPLENYPYPKNISKYVGIPVGPEFHPFSFKEQKQAKEQWKVDPSQPLIVITGGGLGATVINEATAMVLKDLLELGSVVLVSGDYQYDEMRSLTPVNSKKFKLFPFISKDMASLLGAADVVVSRAGATFIMELASLAKPTVLIPNPRLTGGHQVKNAAVYQKKGAVMTVDEESMTKDPFVLVVAIKELLSNPERAQKMAKEFSSFAKPDAAKNVADMIASAIK